MTAWQRHLRFGLGVFVVVLAATLAVSLWRPRSTVGVKPLPSKSDPAAILESTSGELVRALGGRQDLTVEYYERLEGYADGRMTITGGTFKILQRGGRDFLLKARTAELTGVSPDVDVRMKGAVTLTSSDGLTLRTEEASYVNADGMVRAPGHVQFERARMQGTAVGLTYDKARDVLALLDQVVIHNAADELGEGGADIEAGAASFARTDKYVRFERGVKIVGQTQTIEAENAVAFLTPDEKRIQMLELRGSSRVEGTAQSDGGLEAMTARDIDLTYGPDGRTLRRAVLSGDGVINLASSARSPRRTLSGQFIDIGLAKDGGTLTTLNASDRVLLELFADKTTPARTIKSAVLRSSGPESAGLTNATFGGGVEFREMPVAPASPRVAVSSTLDVTMKNGFGSLEAARFAGGVRFEQGQMTATAREARYGMSAGTLNLSGVDQKTGLAPHVIDERATIEARLLDILLDGRKITATESVKTESRGSAEPAAGHGATPAGEPGRPRRSGMLNEAKPVYATSDSLVYDSAVSLATYKGAAQLWQGETTIKADTIVVDDQKGDLSATGRVVSTMVIEQVNAATKAREPVRSVATARQMVYKDTSHLVTYAGEAHLDGPQGDLAADRIELFLKAGGRELERLEGYGNVKIRTPEGRTATGARLTYVAAADEYTMTGTPVTYEDESGETTGNSLTFSRSTDRIVVDGKGQRRTELKRVIKR
jgi:lipopolysaccharide transport protein LptA